MKSGSSAFISSATQKSDIPCRASFHQRSRSVFMETSFSVHLKTNTCSIVGQESSASSTIGLSGTNFSPLFNPSEVNTTFAPASLILSDKLEAENPEKTTECIAPILAQAITENANSGIIGIYKHTRSPLPTPIFLNAFAIRLTSLSVCSYVYVLVLSFGSFGSQKIAVRSGSTATCLSNIFSVMFNVPSSNQRTSGA